MRTCTKCLIDKIDDDFKSRSVCYSCFKMSHDYSKDIKLSPTVNSSFFDDTYANLLKKSGKTVNKFELDAHKESKRMHKTRPEYSQTMKEMNTSARMKMRTHEEA